jgi:hypothetical protein
VEKLLIAEADVGVAETDLVPDEITQKPKFAQG